MKFCEVCDNMMYLGLHDQDDHRLLYRCKNCAHEVQAQGQEMTAVLSRSYVDDDTMYSQYVNPNVKFDPTLPRVNTIKCVNAACTKPPDMDNEVIYIKYDRPNMRYMYFCSHCETFWKSK